MNKLILLGLLLAVSFSFAPTDGYSWAEYAVSRYYCNLGYLHDQYGLACMDGIGDYWDCGSMSSSLETLERTVLLSEGDYDNMCYYSGCEGDPYLPGFRSDMLIYATNSMQFRSAFLSGLRAFLTENPGAREEFFEGLQSYAGEHRSCIVYFYGEPCMPCYDILPD